MAGAPGAVGDAPVDAASDAASALWVPPEPLALTATAVPAVAATTTAVAMMTVRFERAAMARSPPLIQIATIAVTLTDAIAADQDYLAPDP